MNNKRASLKALKDTAVGSFTPPIVPGSLMKEVSLLGKDCLDEAEIQAKVHACRGRC